MALDQLLKVQVGKVVSLNKTFWVVMKLIPASGTCRPRAEGFYLKFWQGFAASIFEMVPVVIKIFVKNATHGQVNFLLTPNCFFFPRPNP